MSKLTIFDTSGNEISPHGNGEKQNKRIEEFAITSLELAADPQTRKIIGCFDVKKSNTQRSEQYWGEYIYDDVSTPIIEFKNAVRRKIGAWEYIFDTDNSRSKLFQYLDHGHPDPPGEEIERRTLKSLAESNLSVNVGVRTPKDAIGLFLEYFDEYSVGIVGASQTGDPSGLDIIITIEGSDSGITPIGETRQQWNTEKRKIKKELRQEQIDYISDTFRYLKTEYGMSSEDIMREVPELSTPDQIRRKFSTSHSSSLIDHLKQSPQQTVILAIIIILAIVGAPYLLSSLGLLEVYLGLPGEILSIIQSIVP